MAREFIITNISSSNVQHTSTAPYVPFVLSIPGPLSIRNRISPYTLNIGK